MLCSLAYCYDVLVIGAGTSGIAAACEAASMGARTAIVECGPVGGFEIHQGHVPRAFTLNAIEKTKKPFNYQKISKDRERKIKKLAEQAKDNLHLFKVELIKSYACFVDAQTIEVGSRHISASYIIIATGSRAVTPLFEGMEHAIIANNVWKMEEVPKSVVISGNTKNATEIAEMFIRLGSKVHLVTKNKNDKNDKVNKIDKALKKHGIKCHFGTFIETIEATDKEKLVILDNGKIIKTNAIVTAEKRSPRTFDLGLRYIGIKLDKRGFVRVDNTLKSGCKNVYAAGSIVKGGNKNSEEEGKKAAQNILSAKQEPKNIKIA